MVATASATKPTSTIPHSTIEATSDIGGGGCDPHPPLVVQGASTDKTEEAKQVGAASVSGSGLNPNGHGEGRQGERLVMAGGVDISRRRALGGPGPSFCLLPLNIHREILGHLCHRDLVTMSRTSKTLRNMIIKNDQRLQVDRNLHKNGDASSESSTPNPNMFRQESKEANDQSRDQRLRESRQSIIDSRRSIVERLYKTYRKELGFKLPLLTPKGHGTICEIGPFKQLINSDITSTLTASAFNAAMEQLPHLLDAWRLERKTILLAKMPAALDWTVPEIDRIPKEQAEEHIAKLYKSTALFVCTREPGHRDVRHEAVSIQTVHNHRCVGRPPAATSRYKFRTGEDWSFECLKFDVRTKEAVEDLAELDPETTTLDEMDRANARFVCTRCPLGGEKARLARTWTSCATHYIDHSRLRGWTRLSREDEDAIIAEENNNLQDPTQRMICHYCDGDARIAASLLKHHMENLHNKDDVNPADYHPDPNIPAQPIPLPKGVKINRQSISQSSQAGATTTPLARGSTFEAKGEMPYHCGHCTGKKGQRGFNLSGVKSHIASVHKVAVPELNVDYSVVAPEIGM